MEERSWTRAWDSPFFKQCLTRSQLPRFYIAKLSLPVSGDWVALYSLFRLSVPHRYLFLPSLSCFHQITQPLSLSPRHYICSLCSDADPENFHPNPLNLTVLHPSSMEFSSNVVCVSAQSKMCILANTGRHSPSVFINKVTGPSIGAWQKLY